jgi:hypothetical protein
MRHARGVFHGPARSLPAGEGSPHEPPRTVASPRSGLPRPPGPALETIRRDVTRHEVAGQELLERR